MGVMERVTTQACAAMAEPVGVVRDEEEDRWTDLLLAWDLMYTTRTPR